MATTVHARALRLPLSGRYLVSRLNGPFRRFYNNRNLLRLRERGLLQTVFPERSDNLQNLMSKQQCIYSGFDPTSDSLHIGNLLVIMVMLHSQRGGHEVIALIGGATALVGDPSGRNTERAVIEKQTVEANAVKMETCLKRIFDNHQNHFWIDPSHNSPLIPLRVLNNMAWYSKQNVIDFQSTVGRCFRMGTMLLKKSVQSRLNSHDGMSFAEFSYQVFQAYDWLYLFDNYKCVLQVGGNDQMGNIHAGHELLSKKKGCQCYGLMVPLITSESGNKLGKTAGNAIWLDPDKLSPFEFYQTFLRLPDSDVEKYLKYFTFLSLGEVQQIMDNHKKSPESWIAHKKLAEQLTLLVHGETGLKMAKKITDILYNSNPETLALLTQEELFQVFGQASTTNMFIEPGITVLQMVLHSMCFANENDCRRIAGAGGLHVNYRKIENPDHVLIKGIHILPNNCSVIRVGKRNYYIVKFT